MGLRRLAEQRTGGQEGQAGERVDAEPAERPRRPERPAEGGDAQAGQEDPRHPLRDAGRRRRRQRAQEQRHPAVQAPGLPHQAAQRVAAAHHPGLPGLGHREQDPAAEDHRHRQQGQADLRRRPAIPALQAVHGRPGHDRDHRDVGHHQAQPRHRAEQHGAADAPAGGPARVGQGQERHEDQGLRHRAPGPLGVVQEGRRRGAHQQAEGRCAGAHGSGQPGARRGDRAHRERPRDRRPRQPVRDPEPQQPAHRQPDQPRAALVAGHGAQVEGQGLAGRPEPGQQQGVQLVVVGAPAKPEAGPQDHRQRERGPARRGELSPHFTFCFRNATT